jgi:hypothetical protein
MRLGEFALMACVALMAATLATSTRVQAQVPTPAPSATPAAVPSVTDQVAQAMRFGDFAELERLYAVYGRPGVRSPLTGTERVKHFWMGVGQIGDSTLRVTEGYYSQMDAMTGKWALDHPQSVLAQLLHADSLSSHAWFLRGTGYANSVSPAAWAGFDRYLKLSFDILRRNEGLFANDSSWNHLMLNVGRGLAWRIDQLLPVFESGIAKNPDHDDLYFTMLTAMLPKWGGDLATAERFIEAVTKKTQDRRGMEMYARLYADLSYSEVKQSLFSATRASWPTMKAGFEVRLSRYPHADNRNMYAYFACMAQDVPALQEQLRLIDGAFERIFWGSRPDRNFDDCKALARQL